MRRYITIVETSGMAEGTLYHGGSGPVSGSLQTPFFTTPSLDMARSYGRVKGRGDGRVTAFTLSPSANIASEETAISAAANAAIDWEGAHISDLFYATGDYQDPALWEIMIDMGFDGVLINDHSYHDLHNQHPTYVIFNADVLSAAIEIERVPSQ